MKMLDTKRLAVGSMVNRWCEIIVTLNPLMKTERAANYSLTQNERAC
jgi:hypothetical protein